MASSLTNRMCRVRGKAKCSDAGGFRSLNLGGQSGRVLCNTPAALSPAKVSAIDCQITLRQAWPQEEPGAAKCVQSVDDQCVLQFTLILAVLCVLNRRTGRVIHREELSEFVFVLSLARGKRPGPHTHSPPLAEPTCTPACAHSRVA
ncbi:hypothetical protein chiPu_0025136 [Chiloscyllium punctatum]|uniref:Uncharacterized protein n=1 Tax=Chiloscyllium punctatum TaxID=137246 RepID=A0A401TEV3_CHIPU|nr:hypothetical protein [Chiloscyllium punctatum]